jgi:phage terminase large subunit-like protein
VSASLLKRAIDRVGVQGVLEALPREAHERMRFEWRVWARPEQLAPTDPWRVWLILAGRGFGKTRTGAEWVREEVESGRRGRIALVAPTAADARDVMVEGESGLLAVSPPWFRPQYEPSKRRITWPNGALATVFTADEPDRLRGPQHDGAWCDELAAWRYPDAWDMLQFGLRLGDNPRVVVTTTPKPARLIRELRDRAKAMDGVIITRGSTYDNAENLADAFLKAVKDKYEGTRLGRQELYAEVLDDVPGALWTRARIDELRVQQAPDMHRVVVAIDPSGGHAEDNDEQGIVVAGLGIDGHGYTLADQSCRLSPDGWGRRAVQAYIDFKADRIVYEKNFGGEMVEHVIQTVARAMGVRVATKAVTASRGKVVRAEPVAALAEQGKDHHVGAFDQLEDEQCQFTPLGLVDSPNRVDAKVWAYTELMLNDAVSLGEDVVASGVFRDADRRRSATPVGWDDDDDDRSGRRW